MHFKKNLLDKAKKPMKEYRKKAGELGADLDLYDRTGLIPATIYQQLKELGFQKKVTQSINTDQAIISELYANKVPPTFYIQLKDSGMFYMGQNSTWTFTNTRTNTRVTLMWFFQFLKVVSLCKMELKCVL